MNRIKKYFIILLWLVGLHSFFVAIGMLTLPASMMTFFGFEFQPGNFFRAQGGAFHIVMAAIYILASYHIDKSFHLIAASVIAKLIGTVFLFSYYILINPLWTVLVSGVGDFLMGAAILIMFILYVKRKYGIEKINIFYLLFK
ncbi:MAG: hypothetical protein V1904_01830 [Bacteroidota bacterium]